PPLSVTSLLPKGNIDVSDVNNGPIPVFADIEEIVGTKTFFVVYQIQTWINETPPDPTAKYPVSPLLAHEWEMEHSVDSDFFLTRTVTGRAVFRSDILQRYGLVPDQFRYWLGHPVPENMKRSSIRVKQLGDGNTLQYQFVDRERILHYDPNII